MVFGMVEPRNTLDELCNAPFAPRRRSVNSRNRPDEPRAASGEPLNRPVRPRNGAGEVRNAMVGLRNRTDEACNGAGGHCNCEFDNDLRKNRRFQACGRASRLFPRIIARKGASSSLDNSPASWDWPGGF